QNQNTNQVLRNMNVTGTTWQPGAPLTQGNTYIWWVRGVDGNNVNGPWSSSLTFSEAVLPAPDPIGPTVTAMPQPTVSWGDVSGADHYDVWLQDLNTNQITRDTNVLGTTWAPAGPLVQQDKYSWWVRAIDPNGYAGAWSASQSFTVYALGAPSLISP